MNIFNKIFQHNWFAIIYFNFRMLPLGQAIKLPFDFYHSIRFENLLGKVKIDSDKLYRGMVKIGGRGSDMFPREQTVLDIRGTWVCGAANEIGAGASIIIEKNANCRFSDKVRIGARTKVYCTDSIIIGEEVDVSWESQIFDTNFHYMEDMSSHKITSISAPIIIGSNNWIGNRVTIMKGTITPSDIIVASNSLLNKDYSVLEKYSVIAGIPAKQTKAKLRRLFPSEERDFLKI